MPQASEPVFLPQSEPGPLDPDFSAETQSGWQPEHPFEQPPVKKEPDGEPPPPAAEEPAPAPTPAPTGQPQVLVQNAALTVQLSADGKMLQFIENATGRMNTQVAYTAENLAQVLASDKAYSIEQKMLAKGQEQTPAAVAQQKSELYDLALQTAKEVFGEVDPEANVEPLAKVISKMFETVQSRQQEQTQAERAFQGEIAEVNEVEPGFDWQHPLINAIRQQYPHYGPKDVYKECLYLASRAKQGAPEPTPAPAPDPAPRLAVPPEIYGRPGGSNGAGPTSDAKYNSHPEVIAAVQHHDKYMRIAGETPTDETRANAKATAIASLKDRELRKVTGR